MLTVDGPLLDWQGVLGGHGDIETSHVQCMARLTKIGPNIASISRCQLG
jgi:hypothetical protein